MHHVEDPLTDRLTIVNLIATRLQSEHERLRSEYSQPERVPSFVLDDLLPNEIALEVYKAFPERERMSFKNSMRERKYISAQMDQHAQIIEETVFAFQHPSVVQLIEEITNIAGLEPDANLYAGGISAMPRGNYLKPHLDNSHDGNQESSRALNLLYYVTPGWRADYGGNLELWDEGVKGKPRIIESRFNRMVLMATNESSWHSVSTVVHSGTRCCVSNYYFCRKVPDGREYFHATSFRGRPEEPVRDLIMQADNALRTSILKMTGTRIYKNPHIYRRK